MIDFSTVSIKKMAIHFVGNKGQDEGVYISKEVFSNFNEEEEESFLQYCIAPFAFLSSPSSVKAWHYLHRLHTTPLLPP